RQSDARTVTAALAFCAGVAAGATVVDIIDQTDAHPGTAALPAPAGVSAGTAIGGAGLQAHACARAAGLSTGATVAAGAAVVNVARKVGPADAGRTANTCSKGKVTDHTALTLLADRLTVNRAGTGVAARPTVVWIVLYVLANAIAADLARWAIGAAP